MANIGKYFEYNGASSKDYNLAIASFDRIDSYETGMSRDIQKGAMNRYRWHPNHFGTVFSDVLSFKLILIKDVCENPNDLEFTRSEYRKVVAWLSEPEYPSLYHMTDFDEDIYDEYEDYYGIFTDFENVASGAIIGIECTFTCDSPFAYSAEQTLEFLLGDSDTQYGVQDVQKSIIPDSDMSYVYPVITIMPNDTTKITITNITDNNQTMTLTPEAANDKIIIDCEKLTITDYTGGYIPLVDLELAEPQDVYWLRFISGTQNDIEVTGNATVTMTYRTVRKVGAY